MSSTIQTSEPPAHSHRRMVPTGTPMARTANTVSARVAGIALWRLDQLNAETAKNRIKANLTANLETPMALRPSDLFAASTWPDDVRDVNEYKFAADLHFVSIPLDRYNDPNVPDEYLKARDCKRVEQMTQIPEDVCIIGALEHYSKVLATSHSAKARLEALSFIVHFMGDLHRRYTLRKTSSSRITKTAAAIAVAITGSSSTCLTKPSSATT